MCEGVDSTNAKFQSGAMPFDREQMKRAAAALAARGVYVGTSSWKYEGWLDQLYTRERYAKSVRGSKLVEDADFLPGFAVAPPAREPEKIDEKRFNEDCLTEYAEVFKTVCFDGAYYKFPTRQSLEKIAAQVPDDFRFGFKVTEAITIKRYPYHPSRGTVAGQFNKDFLNADLFQLAFLGACDAIRKKVGVLIFEFSRFGRSEYEHAGAFVADLDRFFGQLPKGWPYAVELRNHDWLGPEYFSCLAKHGVTHVFNSWEAMPPVGEQLQMPGSVTNPTLIGARFLLKPGRKYQEAVDAFAPYNQTKEVNEAARKAILTLIRLALAATGGNLVRALIYINNRLEGNALNTIADVLLSDEWR